MPHVRIRPELCYRCKTFKRLCGLPTCPVKERLRVIVKTFSTVSLRRSVYGASPPSGVVGEQGYPKVSTMVNLPPEIEGEQARNYEDPPGWWSRGLTLDDIVRIRSSMVSVTDKVNITDVDKLLEKELSLVQVASRPVDLEVNVEKILDRSLIFDLRLLPLSVRVRGSLKVSSNPSIEKPLEKVIYDTDLKARDAVIYLYKSGIDVYTIQRAFSFGLLGTRRFRKLVPTRWAITAVDRILSQYLRQMVKKQKVINKFYIYQFTYLNNRFTVVLMPDTLRISWIEFWYSRAGFCDRPVLSVVIEEDLRGDVETMDGGFEAARMGILEAFVRKGLQARVLIVREILPEYYIGIGNWHIREDLRHILDMKPVLVTESPDELVKTLDTALHPDVVSAVKENINKVLRQAKLI